MPMSRDITLMLTLMMPRRHAATPLMPCYRHLFLPDCQLLYAIDTPRPPAIAALRVYCHIYAAAATTPPHHAA